MAQRSTAGSPRTEGLKPLGTSLLLVLALLPSTLATAGLAAVVVCALVALLLGVTAVRALRTAPPARPGPASELETCSTDLAALGVIAAVGAALIAALPLPLALAAGLGGWSAAGWLAGRDWRLRAGLGVASVVVAGGLGVAALILGPMPLTALVPQWAELPPVLAPAIVAGLWLGGLGGGQWSEARRPGTSRAPWATAGLALLGGLGGVLWTAGRYEHDLVLPSHDAALGGALALAWLSAASTWLARKSRRPLPWVAGGVLTTAWLVGPALALLPVLATVGLPLLIVIGVGASARSLGPAERVVALIAAGVALFAAAMGLSDASLGTLGDAAALATTVVAAFWFVATTLVRRSPEVAA